jgi:hypothetical protein
LRQATTGAPLAIQALNVEPKEDFAIQQLIPLGRRKPNYAPLKSCRGHGFLITDHQTG